MNQTYYLYYNDQEENIFHVYSSDSRTISQMTYSKLFKNYHTFKMIKPFEPTKQGLYAYAESMEQWIKEIRTKKIKVGKKEMRFDPLFYKSLNDMSKGLFKRISKNKYEHHEPISKIEQLYIDDCPNGGLVYLDESAKDKYIQSYSYDYSFDYPKCMSADKLKIPSKQGKEHKLTKIPPVNQIKTGYYRVKITCENKNFRKLFTFSKKHTYTDRSLMQALKHQEEFNVKIELNQDLKYNCYLYDDDCLESGSLLFGQWFRYISDLKEQFPKNGLIKFLGSSLWGQISAKQIRTITEDDISSNRGSAFDLRNAGAFSNANDIENKDMDIGVDPENRYYIVSSYFYRDTQKYKVIDTYKSPEFNIRLKPFLTAYVRNKTARVVTGHIHFGKKAESNVMHDLNDVIRVHTDSVTFRKEMTDLKNIDDLKFENKSSGLIKWVRADLYKNKTTKEFHGKFNDDDRYFDDEVEDE